MAWFLQTPDSKSTKLLTNIADECGAASKGGAAFAFASAMGVKLLTAEPKFQKLIQTSDFTAVIGLDAITDVKTLEELKKVREKYPKFQPKLFLHGTAGSCFHPKTMWLRTADGGVIITGSGNLTAGGLNANWEATAVEKLSTAEMNAAEVIWNAWLKEYDKQLVDLDDPAAIKKAEANKTQRTKIKKALKLPEEKAEPEEAASDVVGEEAEEIAEDLSIAPVLIAEVPKSGDRWKQVNFDVDTYQQFFGVKLGSTKTVYFHQVQNDGTLGPVEERHAVEVKSQNYRFEVGAAQGLPYPENGHPIAIFEKITDSIFKYILLMPGQAEHGLIQKYLDDNYVSKKNQKRRITIPAGELQKVWPTSPLFL